ncbi:MAG: hypothetical protein ACOYON_06650 [Fimbriimonas sp.]
MPYTRSDPDANFVNVGGDDMAGGLGVAAGTIPSGANKVQVNPVGGGTADAAASVAIFAGADGNKALVLQQNSASQTANLMELEASNGNLLAAFGPTGALGIGVAPNSGVLLGLSTGSTTRKGISVIRVASQSANLIEVMDSNGTTPFFVVAGSGLVRIYRGLTLDRQSFAQNGSAIGTISTLQPYVRVTGSGGGTLNMPGSGYGDGQTFWIKNAGSSMITLAGNGFNIDGSASVSLAANAAITLRCDLTASAWDSI